MTVSLSVAHVAFVALASFSLILPYRGVHAHVDGGAERRLQDNAPPSYQCFPSDGVDFRMSVTAYLASRDDYAASDLGQQYGPNIQQWCTSNIRDFGQLFELQPTFDEDISSWDVSQATDMRNMFLNATSFRQNLCPWGDRLESFIAMDNMFTNTSCTAADNVNGRPQFSALSGQAVDFCMPCELSCFTRHQELVDAVRSYMYEQTHELDMSKTSVARTYGHPMNDWCVDNVKDFSGVFAEYADFNENIGASCFVDVVVFLWWVLRGLLCVDLWSTLAVDISLALSALADKILSSLVSLLS